MQIKVFESYHIEHKQLYDNILLFTRSISNTYAEYEEWYRNVFIEGLKVRERMCIIAQDENENLAGCVLIKNTAEEKKICALFVAPAYRKRGLGTQLIDASLKELGEHPLITVSSRNMFQLKPLLDKMGFHMSGKKKGEYGKNDTEFYFNDKKFDSIKNNILPLLNGIIKQKSK